MKGIKCLTRVLLTKRDCAGSTLMAGIKRGCHKFVRRIKMKTHCGKSQSSIPQACVTARGKITSFPSPPLKKKKIVPPSSLSPLYPHITPGHWTGLIPSCANNYMSAYTLGSANLSWLKCSSAAFSIGCLFKVILLYWAFTCEYESVSCASHA